MSTKIEKSNVIHVERKQKLQLDYVSYQKGEKMDVLKELIEMKGTKLGMCSYYNVSTCMHW